MFYCESCRTKNNWPTSLSLSRGACEICGAVGDCYDRPSASLPPGPLAAVGIIETSYTPTAAELSQELARIVLNLTPSGALGDGMLANMQALARQIVQPETPAPTPYRFVNGDIFDANGERVGEVHANDETGRFIVEACNEYKETPRMRAQSTQERAAILESAFRNKFPIYSGVKVTGFSVTVDYAALTRYDAVFSNGGRETVIVHK